MPPMNRWWILFGTLLAIPVVVCVGLFAGFQIAGNLADNEYERRAHAVVATELERAGPNPAQISISEIELNSGFRALPKVLGINAGNVRFTAQYDWLHARGQGFFGSYLSFVYEPVIADSGGVRMNPVRPVGVESSVDTMGYSHDGVGKAIAQGINRALAEAGLRPIAVTSRGGNLTIDLEPNG
jgi:hypothetical protein